MLQIEELMRRGQLLPPSDPARAELMAQVTKERFRLRAELKKPFNQHFGSVFRYALDKLFGDPLSYFFFS